MLAIYYAPPDHTGIAPFHAVPDVWQTKFAVEIYRAGYSPEDNSFGRYYLTLIDLLLAGF